MSKKNVGNSGSALLIAILMSTVVLAVGVGVYQRTYKEILFSSMWRQTQAAFAAADSGLECAVYLELHGGSFCFGQTITWTPPSNGTWWPAVPTYTPVGTGCVWMRIMKTTGVQTVIEARGYNDACGSTNPRRVERGLKITWPTP